MSEGRICCDEIFFGVVVFTDWFFFVVYLKYDYVVYIIHTKTSRNIYIYTYVAASVV